MANIYRKQESNPKVVLHANANTGNVIIAGTGTASNVSANSTEVVAGAIITKVIYGAQGSGYWTLARGANVVATYVNSGVIRYSQEGLPLDNDPAANVVATLVGTTNGSIIIEMKKTK